MLVHTPRVLELFGTVWVVTFIHKLGLAFVRAYPHTVVTYDARATRGPSKKLRHRPWQHTQNVKIKLAFRRQGTPPVRCPVPPPPPPRGVTAEPRSSLECPYPRNSSPHTCTEIESVWKECPFALPHPGTLAHKHAHVHVHVHVHVHATCNMHSMHMQHAHATLNTHSPRVPLTPPDSRTSTAPRTPCPAHTYWRSEGGACCGRGAEKERTRRRLLCTYLVTLVTGPGSRGTGLEPSLGYDR